MPGCWYASSKPMCDGIRQSSCHAALSRHLAATLQGHTCLRPERHERQQHHDDMWHGLAGIGAGLVMYDLSTGSVLHQCTVFPSGQHVHGLKAACSSAYLIVFGGRELKVGPDHPDLIRLPPICSHLQHGRCCTSGALTTHMSRTMV